MVEYINGRIPSLYKLPDFTKLTIESLCEIEWREKKGENNSLNNSVF